MPFQKKCNQNIIKTYILYIKNINSKYKIYRSKILSLKGIVNKSSNKLYIYKYIFT